MGDADGAFAVWDATADDLGLSPACSVDQACGNGRRARADAAGRVARRGEPGLDVSAAAHAHDRLRAQSAY
jgi:hypothetical protein